MGQAGPDDGWDLDTIHALIAELWALRRTMLERARKLDPVLQGVHAVQRASAINLAHYLALRSVDLRPLQERLAEVQEEILWACEAAHMPVVWATQVLETLARTGLPSRAEITDAAMGGRAECVMLNKGPHIVEAMHTLDDILTRMQGHQTKKRSLLRALQSWELPLRRKRSERG